VVVRQPDYLKAFDAVAASTPAGTWREYLSLKLLDAYAGELPAAYADARFDFRGRTLSGLKEQSVRWKRAVQEVEGAMGDAAGQIYVQRYFAPAAKARMDALVANLREAYRVGIDSLAWMSPATKAEAQQKLAKFTVKIAYPDRWRDYSALEVRRGDLLGNAMRANAFQYDEMAGRLGKPVERWRWGMTPQTVNAYYNASMNEIVFPAAILQPPFFNVAADDAVNYGGIGAVIGHEIGHGFDDQGRKSDGSGNLRDWWTAADAKAYDDRAARLGAQYAGHPPDRLARHQPAPHHGREHRRRERARGGLPRLPDVAQGQAGARDRRLHRRPALLHGLRPDLAHQDARRRAPPAAAHRPALAGPGARLRAPAQQRRVPGRLEREAGRQDVPGARAARADLVGRR
jgi:predicted metalloendopeptidase